MPEQALKSLCVATDKAKKGISMELKELLGEDLYKQVQEKIDTMNSKEPDKLKHIRYADLSEGNYVSKAKYDSLEAEKVNLEGQISTLNGTITTLQKENKDNEGLQNTINTLKVDLEKQRVANEQISKMYALKEQLSKAGVVDPDYLIYKQGGIDKFTFDKENHPIGVEEIVKTYKENTSMSYLFQENKGANYNPQGGNSPIKNPFAKETFNLTEQGKLLKENPTQAKELASIAGVVI